MSIKLPILVVALLAAAPVAAGPADPYDLHYMQAQQAYQAGHYADALHELQTAYGTRPWPQLLFNMGKACQKLGRTQDAFDYFDRYLRADLNISPETRAQVEAVQRELRAKLPAAASLEPAPGPALAPATGSNLTVLASHQPEPPRPIYKRWWFWTGIGAVAAGAVVAGVVVGTTSHGPGLPPGLERVEPAWQ